ncbi:hypothetical protein ARMGADRAFT_1035998 [Armillaria gallica]|uniref:Uncharacterized protein n=1 Tax=Armillaria gallica TaxID=47427 RepID=A0A2H3CRX1_ARMGA|nr:hypothetical protein ARMGADRAFT_1035998 [Armillaria gallica]
MSTMLWPTLHPGGSRPSFVSLQMLYYHFKVDGGRTENASPGVRGLTAVRGGGLLKVVGGRRPTTTGQYFPTFCGRVSLPVLNSACEMTTVSPLFIEGGCSAKAAWVVDRSSILSPPQAMQTRRLCDPAYVNNIVNRSTAKYSVGAQLDFLVLSLPDIFDLSLDGIKPWRFGISVGECKRRTYQASIGTLFSDKIVVFLTVMGRCLM